MSFPIKTLYFVKVKKLLCTDHALNDLFLLNTSHKNKSVHQKNVK